MLKSDFKYLFLVPFLSVVFFVFHQFMLSYRAVDFSLFIFKLSTLYLIFAVTAIVIISILIVIKSKNLDIVGMCFLILTSVKMIGAYLLVRPILASGAKEIEVQKMNFFVIFILFLAIETVITIRILNNK